MNTNPLFTNVVLVVIAALLLVLVIQNGMKTDSMARPTLAPVNVQVTEQSTGRNPTVTNDAGSMQHSMFFMAIKAFPEGCKSAKVLDDCNSPAAQAVKSKIGSLVAEGKGPRQVFDYVVATWGEEALTDQARQIRNMRVKGK